MTVNTILPTDESPFLSPLEAYKVVRRARDDGELPITIKLKGDNQRKRVWEYLRFAGIWDVSLTKCAETAYCAFKYER